MAQKIYEIGEQITWKTGNIILKGLIRDDIDFEKVSVICFEINGSPAKCKMDVLKNVIIKEDLMSL